MTKWHNHSSFPAGVRLILRELPPRIYCVIFGRWYFKRFMICLATTAKGHEWCHSREIPMKRVSCPVLEAGWVLTGVTSKVIWRVFFIIYVKCCIWRVRNVYAWQKVNDFTRWNFQPDIDDMVKSVEIWKHRLRKKMCNQQRQKKKPLRQSFIVALIISGNRKKSTHCMFCFSEIKIIHCGHMLCGWIHLWWISEQDCSHVPLNCPFVGIICAYQHPLLHELVFTMPSRDSATIYSAGNDVMVHNGDLPASRT